MLLMFLALVHHVKEREEGEGKERGRKGEGKERREGTITRASLSRARAYEQALPVGQ